MASALSENRQWRSFDWSLVVAVAVLFGYGLMAIFSVTHHTPLHADFTKQIIYLVPGLIGLGAMLFYDYGWLFAASRYIYAINVGLLALVLVAGHSALGAQRWINLGFMTLQPSEFAKLGLIITLAKLLTMRSAKDPRTLLSVALHVGIPALLVFKQPDLGTSLVFGAITIGMLFWAGLPGGYLFCILSPIVSLATSAIGWPLWIAYLIVLGIWTWRFLPAAVPAKLGILGVNVASAFAIPFVWKHLLKEYQRQRLVVFLNPEADPLGSGYHIIQSKVAIGSGGLYGKGWLQGTQTQLHFIPEQHTDFIFSVIGEELGYIGCTILIGVFLFIVWRGVSIARRAKDDFGSLMAIGIVSMILFHTFINIGMTTGIMPVTGIPLPFISFGGTSLLTNLAAVGILLSVSIRRRKMMLQ